MRKILKTYALTVLMLVAVVDIESLVAQRGVGFKAGMGWTTMSDNLLGDNPFFDKGGWSAGFYAVKSFDTQTAIQCEAVYVRTGAQWEGADYQLDYIQFPVMFKFCSQEIEDRIGFLMGIYGAARVREFSFLVADFHLPADRSKPYRASMHDDQPST